MEQHPDFFYLGTLHKTHGVKGDLSASLDTDSPSRYSKLDVVYVEVNEVLKEFTVTKISLRLKERSATIHLMGIEDMNTAENYLKCRLFLPLSRLPKLRGKKFYFHEVIGFQVHDEKLGLLGPISTIYERTEQPVAECDMNGIKVLFPIHDQIIRKIDRESGTFYVELPDGLVDIYKETGGGKV